MGLKLTLDKAMVEAALAEWERDNPGRSITEMTSEEFGDRIMAKLTGTAEIVNVMPTHRRRQ